MIELLAPAGDMECLQTALRFGADAVYLAGKKFGMRGGAKNFASDELVQAVQLAHAASKRVYVTCNIIPHPEDMAALPAWLQVIAHAGVDAVIVGDLGVMKLAQKHAPGVAIHISTQAGVTNAETACALHELGASRVILARELTLEEITQIRQHTPRELELEMFVHGAMCVSYSGRCLLSNYLTGRDANGGACTQPCRWTYALMEQTRPGMYLPIEEDARGTHIMHAQDLCLIEHIPALLAAGITSLKIEGRAKAAYYVAVVVNAYRAALDAALQGKPVPAWVLREPYLVSHREYCTGFAFAKPGERAHISETSGYIRASEPIGIVQRCANGRCYAVQRGRAFAGDAMQAVAPGQPPIDLTLNDLQDEAGQALEATRHAEMLFSFACDLNLPEGAILRLVRV
ncbi:MAG: U32 family peptidase [Oscillospiraceae bacterium]|nr:U32 family peptidase [Oscillospiraceae bacterium]